MLMSLFLINLLLISDAFVSIVYTMTSRQEMEKIVCFMQFIYTFIEYL